MNEELLDITDNSVGKLNGLGDMSSWCSEHPILTFLLVGSAISAVVSIVSNITKKKSVIYKFKKQ